MSYEQRDNSGVLFKNNYKEKELQPDYKGKCMVNGKEMRMAAWIKEGKKGKFMSFSFEEPREEQATDDVQRGMSETFGQTNYQALPDDDMDDDIPF